MTKPTFFFTAMAAVAAHIDKSDRIRFYAEPTKLPEPRPDSPSGLETVHIAVDERRQCILISDRPDLSGPPIFPLMKFLIHAWGQDRAEGRLRRNHRSFRGKSWPAS